ncbi:cupin domain-containing protein [Amycolatopsis sp. NPDC049868]|uniref:cupin domain-containing protein n=1 Tax=Amycolatopsis sp. NPDC049868 TaxID=3363934 RepID=UPI0037AA7678
MAGHTDNSIAIAAPIDLVWDMTNDVESWPSLFSEYASAEIVERNGPTMRIRLTLHPDPDGRVWSWVSDRTPDRRTRTVRAHRVEKGPFEYMKLHWTYEEIPEGTRMRWRQDFAVRPDAPFTEEAFIERLNRNTAEQMRVIKDNIERRDSPPPAEQPAAPVSVVKTGEVEPLPGRGADLRIVLSPRSGGAREGILVIATIRPGESVTEHYHPYSEERVTVITGTMELTLGEHRQEIGPDSSFVIPRGVRHRMACAGEETVRAVLTMSPLAPKPELGHVDTETTATLP